MSTEHDQHNDPEQHDDDRQLWRDDDTERAERAEPDETSTDEQPSATSGSREPGFRCDRDDSLCDTPGHEVVGHELELAHRGAQ